MWGQKKLLYDVSLSIDVLTRLIITKNTYDMNRTELPYIHFLQPPIFCIRNCDSQPNSQAFVSNRFLLHQNNTDCNLHGSHSPKTNFRCASKPGCQGETWQHHNIIDHDSACLATCRKNCIQYQHSSLFLSILEICMHNRWRAFTCRWQSWQLLGWVCVAALRGAWTQGQCPSWGEGVHTDHLQDSEQGSLRQLNLDLKG